MKWFVSLWLMASSLSAMTYDGKAVHLTVDKAVAALAEDSSFHLSSLDELEDVIDFCGSSRGKFSFVLKGYVEALTLLDDGGGAHPEKFMQGYKAVQAIVLRDKKEAAAEKDKNVKPFKVLRWRLIDEAARLGLELRKALTEQ